MRRRAYDEPTMARATAASAYRADMADGGPSVTAVDGRAIIIGTIVEQILVATDEDATRFLADATAMALETLTEEFPRQIIPRALPGNPEIGPLLALSEAIRPRLPILAAFLDSRLLDVHYRLSGEQRGHHQPSHAESRDAIEAALEHTVHAYNGAPQPALGGLSPDQVHELLSGDWIRSGPLRLYSDFTLHDLAGALLLHDARTLLQHLATEGPIKATERGSLSRAGVAALLPKLRIRDEFLDTGRRKVVNESDLMWLELIRILLEGAEFIARRSGAFRITKLGSAVATKEGAGTLFTTLFLMLFQRYSLTFLDRGGAEENGLQSTIACTFFLLARHGAAWQSPESLADLTWMESSRDAAGSGAVPAYDRSPWVLAARVLRPLVMFDLMEEREVGTKLNPKTEYRLTSLFRRFFRFDFPGERQPTKKYPRSVQ